MIQNVWKTNIEFSRQSSKFNFNNISIGISNENLWWGPSIRNGIASNNASGFNHITFNSNKPIETIIGNFEFQFITGKLVGPDIFNHIQTINMWSSNIFTKA